MNFPVNIKHFRACLADKNNQNVGGSLVLYPYGISSLTVYCMSDLILGVTNLISSNRVSTFNHVMFVFWMFWNKVYVFIEFTFNLDLTCLAIGSLVFNLPFSLLNVDFHLLVKDLGSSRCQQYFIDNLRCSLSFLPAHQ